jgi:gliding motility-associated lipoprotein GldD
VASQKKEFHTVYIKISPLFAILMVTGLLLSGCNSTYTSKKKGYFRIPLPEHRYRTFDTAGVPYRFEYPVYANIVRDSTYFDASPENPYWYNIDLPEFSGRIFLSYKIIGGKATYKKKQPDGTYKDSVGLNRFDALVNDAYNLTNKNNVIAKGIDDSVMLTPNGLTGIFFNVRGNAASAQQFFLSDTNRHFIRGALYFEAPPNADSLKPVLQFLQKDLEHLINTFRWKQ